MKELAVNGGVKAAPDLPVRRHFGREEKAAADALFEKIMLSLRTSGGCPMDILQNSKSYVDKLCKAGFAMVRDGNVILTDKGFYLSNTIISDIIAKEC